MRKLSFSILMSAPRQWGDGLHKINIGIRRIQSLGTQILLRHLTPDMQTWATSHPIVERKCRQMVFHLLPGGETASAHMQSLVNMTFHTGPHLNGMSKLLMSTYFTSSQCGL